MSRHLNLESKLNKETPANASNKQTKKILKKIKQYFFLFAKSYSLTKLGNSQKKKKLNKKNKIKYFFGKFGPKTEKNMKKIWKMSQHVCLKKMMRFLLSYIFWCLLYRNE